jgi:tetratricopeptide (TPR) repeat protein
MDIQQKISVLLQQAWDKRRAGKYDESLALLDQVEALCTESDERFWGRIYHIRRQLEVDQERHEQALPFAQLSVKHYQASGDNQRIAHAIRHLADLEQELGQFDTSEAHYREAIQGYINHERTTKSDLANCLRGYALLKEEQQDAELAKGLWEEVKTLYEACEIYEGVKEANKHLEALQSEER